jgi:hypothetical protein
VSAAWYGLSLVPARVRRDGNILAGGRGDAVLPAGFQPSPGARPVYAYSVIRGGAYNATELIRALDRDSVAERHYGVFRPRLVHTTGADFARPVYLSYRIGDAIYWTRRPVSLPRGEALLTDGENYARARCGNRISQNPQTPVNYIEPPPQTLNLTEPP